MWIILVSRNVSIVTLLWRNSNVPVKSMQVKKYKRQFEMYVNKPTLNELRKNRGRPNRRRRGSRRRRCTQLLRVASSLLPSLCSAGCSDCVWAPTD